MRKTADEAVLKRVTYLSVESITLHSAWYFLCNEYLSSYGHNCYVAGANKFNVRNND